MGSGSESALICSFDEREKLLPRHYEVFYLNYGQINADEAAQVVVTALCHQIFVKRIPRPIYEFLLLRDKNLFSRASTENWRAGQIRSTHQAGVDWPTEAFSLN
jgi:hypothetical protein